MGLVETVSKAVTTYRSWRRERQPGAMGAYYRAGGDAILVRDLPPMAPGEVVVDAGGYQGDFAALVLERFGSPVIVLEPLPSALEQLRTRFQKNPLVEILPAALGGSAGEVDLQIAANASSMVPGAVPFESSVRVKVMGISELFGRLGDRRVGCFKLNIEGAEFDVLEHLVELGLQSRVGAFLIQFHRVGNDSERRREAIRRALGGSHREQFSFDFVWELWVRR